MREQSKSWKLEKISNLNKSHNIVCCTLCRSSAGKTQASIDPPNGHEHFLCYQNLAKLVLQKKTSSTKQRISKEKYVSRKASSKIFIRMFFLLETLPACLPFYLASDREELKSGIKGGRRTFHIVDIK